MTTHTIKTISILVSALSLSSFSLFSKPAVSLSEYDRPEFRQAFFDAAKVYGKAGCGDFQLAELTARSSVKSGLPSKVIAATIAVESSCDPLAVSRDGGVGLLQVMPRVWASQYNNFQDKNLLKAEDSMAVGVEILANNVRHNDFQCKPAFFPLVLYGAVALLGAIIFGYFYWQSNYSLKYSLGLQLSIAGLGLLIFCYGFSMFLYCFMNSLEPRTDRCDFIAYGLKQGIRRYNGSGLDAEIYAGKVSALAGVK